MTPLEVPEWGIRVHLTTEKSSGTRRAGISAPEQSTYTPSIRKMISQPREWSTSAPREKSISTPIGRAMRTIATSPETTRTSQAMSEKAKSNMSKKCVHPCGMAPAEWTCSVRAVRDTPVADYCALGVNTTRRVACRPPTAVSPFHLALWISDCKRTLWRCGQLWPYIRMRSLGTRLHRNCNVMGDATKISSRVPSTCAQQAILSLLIIRDCNAMGDAAKISPCIPSTCAQNAILSLLIIRDCKAMGDAGKISPRVPSTCAQNAILSLPIIRDCKAMGDAAKISPRVPSHCPQNAILSLLIIHIIPSRQIYVAIDNPSLVPFVSCLTTSSYLWNYVRAADDVSHSANLENSGCRYFSHVYKSRDGIQVTWVFRYCGERQG